MTLRECANCQATNKTNHLRCKNRTCTTGKFCWIHLQKILKLRVKTSTIPNAGKGLFASTGKNTNGVVFKKNQIIAPYTGREYTKADFETQFPGDQLKPYALLVGRNKYVDAFSTQSSVARYANDCKGSRKRCNAKLTEAGNLKAKFNIKEGQEILASYGSDYWGNSKKRKRKKT
jgi:hypothetical protein